MNLGSRLGLYYICSENKGADLRLCILHMQKAGFLTAEEIRFQHGAMLPNDTNGIANGEDPDQNAFQSV